MKQKYIFHLKIYIFFQSCLVLKTDSLGCQCCQCREPINDLVSGVVLKRKLDVGFAPFSLYRKGNRHSFSKYDGNRSQFSRDIKNIPVNLSRSTDISIKISPTRSTVAKFVYLKIFLENVQLLILKCKKSNDFSPLSLSVISSGHRR